jgi:hypothetical protein
MQECLHFDEELGDFWHYDVTVDVELRIPARLVLRVRTMRGDVVVSGVEGNVDLATNDGEIRLREIRGNLSAAALGSVDLETLSVSSPRPSVMKVTAYTGDVTLRVPAGERIRMNGTQFVMAQRNATELLRTEGGATRDASVSVGQFGPSLDVGITRGRLIVMPIGASQR